MKNQDNLEKKTLQTGKYLHSDSRTLYKTKKDYYSQTSSRAVFGVFEENSADCRFQGLSTQKYGTQFFAKLETQCIGMPWSGIQISYLILYKLSGIFTVHPQILLVFVLLCLNILCVTWTNESIVNKYFQNLPFNSLFRYSVK